MSASGRVVSVNVSAVRTVEHQGKAVATGIFKQPVEGSVCLRGVNLDGDDQADRANHGGPVRAAYAYAREDYRWWEETLGRTLPPGKFGENLTLCGIDVNGALVGERWRIGSAVVQVTSPRVPCYKLALTMGDPAFVRKFAQALRPGAYLSIVEEGAVGGGAAVEVVWRPAHRLTIAEMTRIYFSERERLRELLVRELPDHWRAWVLAQLGEEAPDAHSPHPV
jgi:MOSC domain-containing protein YiiM